MIYGEKTMKIVATVRTFNESKHIEQWCKSYSEFADVLLVADGGSTDNTLEIASKYPKVQIRNYDVKVQLKDGSFRNPDGPHVQFCVDWATEIGGDWIVHQDCDQRPNKFLKEDARDILSTMDKDFLQVTQIFLWGKEQYFPLLSCPGGVWMQGLWAWRLSTNLKIINNMPHYMFSLDGTTSTDINKTGRELNIQPPYCFMHYGWQTEEETWEHVNYYRRTGLIPMAYPLDFAGSPAPLLDWMLE
jgi:hypothetical protein